MTHSDDIARENIRKHNPNWAQILDYSDMKTLKNTIQMRNEKY